MSITSATAAQVLTARDKAAIALPYLQRFAQGDLDPRNPALDATLVAKVNAALDAALSALRTAGAVLPATQTVVVNGQALTGVAPTGTYTSRVTFTVASGAITAIALS